MTDDPNLLVSCTLRGRGEILEKLRMLEKRQCLLTATVPGDTTGFLTAIVKILPEKGLVAVDASANESLNNSLLEAEKVYFSARVDGIEANFAVSKLQQATLNGHEVFALSLPDTLFWLQRRRYYRVHVPVAVPIRCHIPLTAESMGEFEVLDLGLEGVSLLDKSDLFDPDIEPGYRFDGCLLLPHLAGETLSLEVRNVLKTTTGPTNRPALRVGCALYGSSRGFEVHIQRLLYDLEMQKKRADSLFK